MSPVPLIAVTGPVVAISHLFYLPRDSKLLFLVIGGERGDEGGKTVVFSLSSNLLPSTRTMVKRLLSSPPSPGTMMTITHLKSANIHDKAVFRSTRQTTVTISDADGIAPSRPLQSSTQGLITYRGIVTKSGESGDGVHTLDKRVTLVSPLLCIATNLPHLPLGAVVTVHQAHCLQWRGQRVLLLCGASRLEVEGGQEIHPSPDTNTLRIASPLVSVVQEGGQCWAACDLLQLRDNLVEARQSLGVNIGLGEVLNACLMEKGVSGRSLTKEFLDHGKGCGLVGQGGKVTPLLSVKDLLEREEGDIEGSLVGQLAWSQSGLLELIQATGMSILVRGEWGPLSFPARILASSLMLVKEPTRQPCLLVREWRCLQLGKPVHEENEGGVEIHAAVVERGPVKVGRSGKLFSLALLEIEGEGRSLVQVEALDTLLHWVPGCKLSLSASCLRPPSSPLDWDHTELLGPLPLLYVPDGSPVYSLREAAEAPLGELINMTGLLVCKEQEEEAKVKLVFDEEGEEIALYLPSSSLPPATLPGMRFEATSVKRAISKKGRSYLRSTPLTRLELVLSTSSASTYSPRMLISLDTIHSLNIEVDWSAKAVAGVLTAGKLCCSLSTLVFSSLDHVRLLLNCSDQDWQKLLNSASTHGSISIRNSTFLLKLCQNSLANLAYYWVMVRYISKGRFFCQGMSRATPEQLIHYFESQLE